MLPMSQYRIWSHAEFLADAERRGEPADIAAALDHVSHAAFGQYDGVIAGNPEFKGWFMSRPGMTDDSRLLAELDGEIVSSVFVTCTPMQWAGEVMAAGLIDSVMTHPAHRRRGLARRLLDRALRGLESQQADLSLLYTVAGSMAYEFYASMGYVDCLRVHVLCRSTDDLPNAPPPAPQPIDSAEFRSRLDALHARHDGYLPMSQELWEWRRERRPAFVPVWPHALELPGGEPAAFAVGQAPIRKAGHQETMSLLNDCAPLSPALFEHMLAAVPAGPNVMMLCAETNEADHAACEQAGFRVVAGEACMIKPLSPRADRALHQRPQAWYTVTETVVGI